SSPSVVAPLIPLSNCLPGRSVCSYALADDLREERYGLHLAAWPRLESRNSRYPRSSWPLRPWYSSRRLSGHWRFQCRDILDAKTSHPCSSSLALPATSCPGLLEMVLGRKKTAKRLIFILNTEEYEDH